MTILTRRGINMPRVFEVKKLNPRWEAAQREGLGVGVTVASAEGAEAGLGFALSYKRMKMRANRRDGKD